MEKDRDRGTERKYRGKVQLNERLFEKDKTNKQVLYEKMEG